MVEVIRAIDGVTFEAAHARRTIEAIDPTTGLRAPYISADDLLDNKLAAGRLQDLADAEAIREARAGAGGPADHDRPERDRDDGRHNGNDE